jgi:hypothetical protein
VILRLLRYSLFLVPLAFLTGCRNIDDAASNMRDRIAGRDDARTRTYPASQRTVYQAARSAAEKMGYRIQRGGAAQGFIEAVSGIGQGEVLRTSHQIAMKVTLKPAPSEGTEVTVRLTEIVEAEGANRSVSAQESPLQGTPQYEVFFRLIQQAVDAVDNKQ